MSGVPGSLIKCQCTDCRPHFWKCFLRRLKSLLFPRQAQLLQMLVDLQKAAELVLAQFR